MIYNQVDLLIDSESEDLAINEQGSISYIYGNDTPPNAVIRRLGTPIDGYARMVRETNSTVVYNRDYFSNLPAMLSTSNFSPTAVETELDTAAARDGRITPTDLTLTQAAANQYSFTLSYTLDGETVQNITSNL